MKYLLVLSLMCGMGDEVVEVKPATEAQSDGNSWKWIVTLVTAAATGAAVIAAK